MNVRSRTALLCTSLLTLVLCATNGAAQTITATPITPLAPAPLSPKSVDSTSRQHVGPAAGVLSVAVQAPVPVMGSAPARGSAGLGQSEALMIVGGAAILVGAIVGHTAGDFFIVGGAIVGLYGLYKYLQ